MANEETVNYEEDPREPCKYGERCYQKNPNHHAKFKHPPNKKENQASNLVKKRKSTEENESKGQKKLRPTSAEDETDIGKHSSFTEHSVDCEDVEPDHPASPEDVKESIKQKFLIEMPEDFYSFWDFCHSLNPRHPEDALEADLNLQLVGPFDVLSGKIKSLKPRKQSTYLRYYRYYYDPPEFQTVIKGDNNAQYHLGYFRDAPDEKPVFVAENEASKGCVLKPLGENLFAAVNAFLEDKTKEANKKVAPKLEALRLSLQKWAKKSDFSLERKTSKMKNRDKVAVAKSFHGAGIVVPYDKKSQVGYRPLPESNGNLRKMLQSIISCQSKTEKDKRFDNLQEIITLVQFANDERDYGMGFELAMDLFCFGDSYFHPTILAMLPLAYELLNRPEFGDILKAHLSNRQKVISEYSAIK